MRLLLLALLITSTPAFDQIKAATTPHQATLYYQSTSCTSSKPCSIQVWRAVCAQPNSCPTYSPGATAWTRVSSGAGSATPTATGTTWVIYDQDPVLQDATTYVYVATTIFQSGGSVSAASPSWSGTTQAGGGAPAIPTVGTGNSVN